jgi:hypothetical protein
MRGFILAAGLGTRLRPLTDHTPKPLVPVAGVPLVERAVLQLRDAGVREIGVNLFHLGQQIADYLGDGSRYGVKLQYFFEGPEILGTGGGLKNAEGFLRGGGDSFVLANGDVWHDFDLNALVQAHQPQALATLLVHRAAHRPELHRFTPGSACMRRGCSTVCRVGVPRAWCKTACCRRWRRATPCVGLSPLARGSIAARARSCCGRRCTLCGGAVR